MMSLQSKLLLGTALIAVFGAGVAQSVSASPTPGETDASLISQASPMDNEVYTRIPGEIERVMGDDYVRVQMPDGESRLVTLPDTAFDTRRMIPGADVILTMQGNRIVDIALASPEDLIALEEEQRAREEALRANVSEPEQVTQTDRQDTVVQRQQTQTAPATAPASQPPRPVRAMW